MKIAILGLVICSIFSYGLIQNFNSAIPRNEPLTLTIDHRTSEVSGFMLKHQCPKPYYIKEYLNAADKYNLDYRLLPAISIQESSCGRHYRFNNYWGWNSARTGFESVQYGIDFVTGQLSEGHYYKNKTITQKLKTYNSENPEYYKEVLHLMDQMKYVKPYKITI